MIRKNKILQSSIIILLISNFANFLQYLSQFILGRTLSPEEFGIFNSVHSLLIISQTFALSLSFSASREFIRLNNNKPLEISYMKDLLKKTILIGICLMILFLLLSSYIADYLLIQSVIPIIIFALINLGIILQSSFNGILQGLSKYEMMSIGQVVQTGSRLLFIILAVIILNFSYNGALLGVFASYIIALIFYLFYLSDYIFVKSAKTELPSGLYKQMFSGSLHLSLMWAYFSLASNIDIPIVKHYFSEYEAGIYSAGAIIGRIVWFLSGVLLYILFPEIVRSTEKGTSSVPKVLAIGFLTCLISGGLALFITFFPEFVLRILMGEKYIEASQILIIISYSMVILAVLSVLFNFYIAKKITFFLLPTFIIFIGIITSIYFYLHSSPLQIAYAFLYGLIITLVVNLLLFFIRYRPDVLIYISNFKKDRNAVKK